MLYNIKECRRRITNLRIKHGYTQERLAAALYIDRSLLSRVEAGRRSFTVEIYIQLSALFDVFLDYLLLGKTQWSDEDRIKENVDKLIIQLETFSGNLR